MNHPKYESIPNNGIVPTGQIYEQEEALVFLHGSWFTHACWNPVRSSFDDEYRTIAPRMPTDKEHGDFNECATSVTRQIQMSRAEKVILIAHSRGSEIAPRVAGKLALEGIGVEMMILVCPGISENTFGCLNKNGTKPELPPKIIDKRMKELVKTRGVMSRLASRELAIALLYNGEEPPLDLETRLVIEGMRATRRTELEPTLDQWPANVPTGVIVAENDRVVSPARGAGFSRDWLGVEPVILPGASHMVISTHPSIFSDAVRDMIENRNMYLPSSLAAEQSA